MNPAWSWEIGADRILLPQDFTGPLLMAIINATPDSFSDGGVHLDPDRAVESALAAIAAGASIIDVGGESTRPGAANVDAEEQCRRVVPVIRGVRQKSAVAISVDTTLSSVACAALDAGADIVNDTSAGRDDPQLLRVVAQRGCGIVLMHRRARPAQEVFSDQIERSVDEAQSIVDRVRCELAERVAAAVATGVRAERIAIDPGLGFGKSVNENFALLRRLHELHELGRPVVVGASRKSFIGAASGVESPSARLAGSISAAVIAAIGGAAVIRVHDVEPHRQALAVVQRTVLPCSTRNRRTPWLATPP